MQFPDDFECKLARDGRFLVLSEERASLATSAAPVGDVAGVATTTHVVDLRTLWASFAPLMEGRESFLKSDLAKAGGVSFQNVTTWQLKGLLPRGSGRPETFGIRELFAAGLIGALYRAGVNKSAISRASDLVCSIGSEVTA